MSYISHCGQNSVQDIIPLENTIVFFFQSFYNLHLEKMIYNTSCYPFTLIYEHRSCNKVPLFRYMQGDNNISDQMFFSLPSRMNKSWSDSKNNNDTKLTTNYDCLTLAVHHQVTETLLYTFILNQMFMFILSSSSLFVPYIHVYYIHATSADSDTELPERHCDIRTKRRKWVSGTGHVKICHLKWKQSCSETC